MAWPDDEEQEDPVAAPEPEPAPAPRPLVVPQFEAALGRQPQQGESGEAFWERQGKLAKMGVVQGSERLPSSPQEAQAELKQVDANRESAARDMEKAATTEAKAQAQAQKQAATDAKRAESDAARQAKAAEVAQHRFLKSQGVEFAIGPDGKSHPKQHADARLVYGKSFVGDPYLDEASGRYVRDYRDEFGEMQPKDLEEQGGIHTDPKTGERYYKAGGARQNIGQDETFAERQQIAGDIAQKRRDHAVQRAEIARLKLEADGPGGVNEAWKAIDHETHDVRKALDSYEKAVAQNPKLAENDEFRKLMEGNRDRWAEKRPAFDAAKAAKDEHEKLVRGLELEANALTTDTLRASSKLESLKRSRGRGKAPSLEMQVQDVGQRINDEFKTTQDEHQRAVEELSKLRESAFFKPELTARIPDMEKRVREKAAAITESAAKAKAFNGLMEEAGSAEEEASKVAAEANQQVQAITRTRQQAFAEAALNPDKGGLWPEQQKRFEAGLNAAKKPIQAARERAKAAATKLLETLSTPEQWQASAERDVAMQTVQERSEDWQARSGGTSLEGLGATLGAASKVADTVDGVDINQAIKAVKTEETRQKAAEEPYVGPYLSKAVSDVYAGRRADAAFDNAVQKLVTARDVGGKQQNIGGHWSTTFRELIDHDKSLEEIRTREAGLHKELADIDKSNGGGKGLARFLAQTNSTLGGITSTLARLTMGRTAEQVMRTREAQSARQMIGNLDAAGAKQALGLWPELEKGWETSQSVLTPEQKGAHQAAVEAGKDAWVTFNDGNRSFRVLGSGKATGLASNNLTLGGAEELIKQLSSGKGGKTEAFGDAFFQSLLGVGSGNIEIDESNPREVAQRAFLQEKLADAIYEKTHWPTVAASGLGSMASFMGAGLVGRMVSARLAAGASAGTQAAVRGAVTGGTYGTDISLKTAPGDMGGLNRALDIAGEGVPLMLSEKWGDFLGERAAAKLAGMGKSGAAQAAAKFAGRAVGLGGGEVASDSLQNLMQGKSPFDGFAESLVASGGGIGLGGAILGAIADRMAKGKGGRAMAGRWQSSHTALQVAQEALDAARQTGDVAAQAAAQDGVMEAENALGRETGNLVKVSGLTSRSIGNLLGTESKAFGTALSDNPVLQSAAVGLGEAGRDAWLAGPKQAGALRAVQAEGGFDGESEELAAAAVDQHVGVAMARDLAGLADGSRTVAGPKLAVLDELGLTQPMEDGGSGVTDQAIGLLPSAMQAAILKDPARFRVKVTPDGLPGAMIENLTKRARQRLHGAVEMVTTAAGQALEAQINNQQQGGATVARSTHNREVPGSIPGPATKIGTSNVQRPTSNAQWKVNVQRSDGERVSVAQWQIPAATQEEAIAKGRKRAERMGGNVVDVRAELIQPVAGETSQTPAAAATAAQEPQGSAGTGGAEGTAEVRGSEPKPETQAGGTGRGVEGSAAVGTEVGVVPQGTGTAQGKPATAAPGTGGGEPVPDAGADAGKSGKWYVGTGVGRVGKRLSALERAGVEIKQGTSNKATADEAGKLGLELNPATLVRPAGEATADEEIEHHFAHVVLADHWREAAAAGTFKGDFLQFRMVQMQRMLGDLMQRVQALGDPAEKQAADDAVTGAFNVYYGKLKADAPPAKNAAEAIAKLRAGVEIDDTDEVAGLWNFAMELSRMLGQMQRRGEITEQTHRVFRESKIGQWVQAAVDAIKALAAKLLDMGHPLHASQIARFGREVRAKMDGFFDSAESAQSEQTGEQESTESTEPPRKSFRRAVPPAPGGWDIIEAVLNDVGKLRSRATAHADVMRRRGLKMTEAWKEVGGEYDGIMYLPPRLKALVFARKGSGISPDEAANALSDAGVLKTNSPDALWNELAGAWKTRLKVAGEERQLAGQQRSADKQADRFEKDALEPQPGAQQIPAGELNVGDTVEVEGHTLKVTAIDPDTENVTLEDGATYGVQDIEDGQVIYGVLEKGAPVTGGVFARREGASEEPDLFRQPAKPSPNAAMTPATLANWGRVLRKLNDLEASGAPLNAAQRELLDQAEDALAQEKLALGPADQGTMARTALAPVAAPGGLRRVTDLSGDLFDEKASGGVGKFAPGQEQGSLFAKVDPNQFDLFAGADTPREKARVIATKPEDVAPVISEKPASEGRAEQVAMGLDVPRAGFKEMAQRIVNAEERFLSFAQETGELSRPESVRALAEYRKVKAVKIDPVTGQFTFTHGGFADKEVLRRAAGLDVPREAGTVADFGEKIGGARKDTARKLGPQGPREAKPDTSKPGWSRRYEAREETKWTARSTQDPTGKWTVWDKTTERQRGTYPTQAAAEAAIPLVEVARNHRIYQKRIKEPPPTAAQIESANVAADAIVEHAKQISKLREENAGLLMSKDLTDRYRAAFAEGKIDQAQAERIKAGRNWLNDEDYARAVEVQRRIDEMRDETPLSAPEKKPEGEWGIHRVVGEYKRPLVKGGFASEEEAKRYMAAHPVEIIEHKFQFPNVPWLESINREGPSYRTGNVSPQQFQSAFGFRGGEFGNWNMGSEGQAALNHGFDALMDLARLLKLPPKALSLNGRLGIAFGARGTGGENSARAHYEPGYRVINLTKIHGAGSLAHEWLHALDHYIGAFPRYGEQNAGKSLASASRVPAEMRPEVKAAFDDVLKSLFHDERSEDVPAEVQASQKAGLEKYVREALADIRRNFIAYPGYKKKAAPTEGQLKAFDTMAEKIATGQAGELFYKMVHGPDTPASARGAMNGHYTYPLVQQLNALYKSVTGASFDRKDDTYGGSLRRGIAEMQKVSARQSTGEAGTRTVKRRTQFFDDAREIDMLRAEDYWSVPEEMLARAFAGYIYDHAGGEKSQYLVHAADNKYFRSMGLKPYPEGEERTRINEGFDRLFGTLKVKEESGSLYAKVEEGNESLGEVLKPVDAGADFSYDNDRERHRGNLGRALEYAQNDARGIGRPVPGDGDPSASVRAAVSAGAIRQLDAAAFERARESGRLGANRGRNEHSVYLDERSGRAIKVTKPGEFGARTDLEGYLRRLAENNALWDDDLRLEGAFIQPDGTARLVVTQPIIKGKDAPPAEIKAYMRGKGFRQYSERSYWDGNGTLINDTEPVNVLMGADGKVYPIDVIPSHPPERAWEMYDRVADARERDTGSLFARTEEQIDLERDTIAQVPIPKAVMTASGRPVPAGYELDKSGENYVPKKPGAEKHPEGVGAALGDWYSWLLQGRLDRIERLAPGSKNVIVSSEMDAAKVRAGLREMMEAMLGRMKRVLGKTRDAAGQLRRKQFTAELLPTAARLNATGYDADDNLVFDDFEMRAGQVPQKIIEKAGLTTGDLWTGAGGEVLKIGELLEDLKAYQLLRPMSRAAQEAVYQRFHDRYAETAHMLDEFIAPDLEKARVTDPRGTVLPAFNRHALRDFFGEVSPHGELAEVAGYVPEVQRTRTLAGAIAGAVQNMLNRNFKSGAREYKSGAARETGNVKNLFEAFGIRAMEAHAEAARLATAEKLLPLAVKDMPATGLPFSGWMAVNEHALPRLADAYGGAMGMDRDKLVELTRAVTAGDEAALKKIVGKAWAELRGKKMIRKEVFSELVRPLADKETRSTFARVFDTLTKSYTAGLLAHPFSWIQNIFSNELFKMMRASQRALYAAAVRPVNRRESRGAFLEAKELVKGMIFNRWWDQKRINEVVPPEYFEGNTSISGAARSITEDRMTAWDHVRQANIPQALLSAARYQNMDVRAKQQLAYASYIAQAQVAMEEAEAKGFVFRTKAQRTAWMKDWLNTAPETVHRRGYNTAVAYAMDYSSVPWWADSDARVMMGTTDITAFVNIMRRLTLPFIKWPYNLSRQMKRFGADSSVDVLAFLAGKTLGHTPGIAGTKAGDVLRGWASARGVGHWSPRLANSVAHLGTFALMLGVMRAWLNGGDDKDEWERLGRSFDLAGKRLDRAYDTSSRVDITDLPILGPAVSALAKMYGNEKNEQAFWLRVRTIPYASPMLALAAAQAAMASDAQHDEGNKAAAWAAFREFVADFQSEGVLLSVLNTIRGSENKYTAGQNVSTVLGGAATDLLTSRLLPPPLMSSARDFVDPQMRRLRPSPSLDYNPGFAEGVKSRLPGLSKSLPPAGRVKTMTMENAAKVPGVGDWKLKLNEQGKPEASFVDPEDERSVPRWRTALRFAGMNVKPVEKAAYERAVRGEETGYRRMLRKAASN